MIFALQYLHPYVSEAEQIGFGLGEGSTGQFFDHSKTGKGHKTCTHILIQK